MSTFFNMYDLALRYPHSSFLLFFWGEMLIHVNISSGVAVAFKSGTSSCVKSVSGSLSVVLL